MEKTSSMTTSDVLCQSTDCVLDLGPRDNSSSAYALALTCSLVSVPYLHLSTVQNTHATCLRQAAWEVSTPDF